MKTSTWHLRRWKISANEMEFRQILLKIERATILRSKNTEASNFQVRLQFMVAFRNWYFIAKTLHYCDSHLYLIRITYLRISKTMNNSAARHSKQGGLLYFKLSGVKTFCLYFYLIKFNVLTFFPFQKTSPKNVRTVFSR